MAAARPLAIAVLLGSCAVLLSAALAPGQQRDPLRELPDLFGDVVPELRVEQVVRFGVRADGDLTIATDLKTVQGVRQVRLAGLEGVAQVQLGRRSRGAHGGLVPFFTMDYRGPAGPAGGSVQTTVKASAAGLNVTRVHRLEDRHSTVTVNQEPPGRGRAGDPGRNRVLLKVRVTTSANVVVEDLRVTAGSFDELLRNHPGPAARHLAPVFRDFGQDAAVFGVDPHVAWQLFPEAADKPTDGAGGADAELTARVLALVKQFDDDDFRVREAAAARLSALGGPAVAALAGVERASLSAEQNGRIDVFLADYGRLDPAEVAGLLEDPEFLLRCFTYCDAEPARAAAARALEAIVGHRLGLDPARDLPARTRAAAFVREELPEPEPAMAK